MVIAAVEIFLINRELYLGRSQGSTTWNAIMRRVFHKRSDIKFEPQSTIFVVICWKAVKVAVCMFEETSAYFNGTVKQLSLLVHRVLVFIIRVKSSRTFDTSHSAVPWARSHLYFEIHLLSSLHRAISLILYAKILCEGIQTPMIFVKSTFAFVSDILFNTSIFIHVRFLSLAFQKQIHRDTSLFENVIWA